MKSYLKSLVSPNLFFAGFIPASKGCAQRSWSKHTSMALTFDAAHLAELRTTPTGRSLLASADAVAI